MLEAYSNNQTFAADSPVTFNSVSLRKGMTAVLNGASTIELNKCGVYEIILTVSGLPSEAGDVVIQMMKDGVLQPQAIGTVPTALTTTGISTTIATLVVVRDSNSCRCCDSPVTIQFINSGVGLADADARVVVTKIC